MAKSLENNAKLKQKLKDQYRMVIIEEDTLKEVKSTRFSISKLIALFLVIILIYSLLILSIVSYTPARFLIPGYGDINNNKVYVDLKKKIDEIERELELQRTYTEGIKRRLNPTNTKLEDNSGTEGNFENFSNEIGYNKKLSNNLSIEHYYFCSPLKGEISAEFDPEINHFGVDVVAPASTPIQSILDGVVINADWSAKTGNTISIQHDNNLISIYKHNSVLLKNVGDQIKKCEAVAIIGNSGELSSGPHVHFELWNNGIPVNPSLYINVE